MGMRVVGKVADGYKYLSPCSCLLYIPTDARVVKACIQMSQTFAIFKETV